MIVTPFGDTQAHGAFGKSVILERRRGIVYAKSFRIPKNPRSILQKIQRQKFTAAIAGWQSLTPLEQDYFNQLASGKTYTGFNLYVSKQLLETPPSTTPILIKIINNVVINNPRSPIPNGWVYRFFDYGIGILFGEIIDSENVYLYLDQSPTPINVLINFPGDPVFPDIHAGDSVTITYDDTNVLTIWLPKIVDELDLYFADDGSTYWDEAMTNLAQAAP